MMDFSKFEAGFVKKNKILWLSLGLSLLMSSTTLALILSKERYFVVSNGEIFKERPLLEDVCLESFVGMARGLPNSNLISKGIMDILNSEPFELNIEKVLKVKSLEQGKCQIIVKGKGGLRSFKIGMISNDNFPFFYKLNELDEIEPEKEQ